MNTTLPADEKAPLPAGLPHVAVILLWYPLFTQPFIFREVEQLRRHLPLTVYYSTKYFAMLPGGPDGSLMPDIEVERTLTDYVSGKDTALQAVLEA